MTTVIVCGGRDFFRPDIAEGALNRLHREQPITRLVQGGAKGADTCARWWAKRSEIPAVTYAADWITYPRAAGPIRNEHMLKTELALGSVRCLLAFPGGNGTEDMVARAKKAGVVVLRVVVNGDPFEIVRDA